MRLSNVETNWPTISLTTGVNPKLKYKGQETARSRILYLSREPACPILLKALPQERDRRLFIDALELGCDIFLTMDYRTIWRRRGKVKEFGIKIMRPVELFEYVRPWAGLLR